MGLESTSTGSFVLIVIGRNMAAEKSRPEFSPDRPSMTAWRGQDMGCRKGRRQQAMCVDEHVFFPVRQENIRRGNGAFPARTEPRPHRTDLIRSGDRRCPAGQAAGHRNLLHERLRPKKRTNCHDALHVLRIFPGIQERAESSHRDAGQPDRAISRKGGGEQHVLTELLEKASIRIVAVMGVYQQNIGRPGTSLHEASEAPLFKISCLIADTRQADQEIS